MRKKILFVINTFSRAGAETALLDLLYKLDGINDAAENKKYEISLFVLMGQGELASRLPESVHLLNRKYSVDSVLEPRGKRHMMATVLKALLHKGTGVRLTPYMLKAYRQMRRSGEVRIDKLLWRALSDGAPEFDETYDLAIAFLEGGSAYYVADHVKAKKKAGFIHTDYIQARYTTQLDGGCYDKMDGIFAIGEHVRDTFLQVHPECKNKIQIFHNIINTEAIRSKACLQGGFTDPYDGFRILTVGRLIDEKAYPVAIETMRLLRADDIQAKWYVLGEGDKRKELENLIIEAHLEECFYLLGAEENPYPYFAQCDLYVHATKIEGKSIAIQEAQVLGCPIVASEINREQITDGTDGFVRNLDPNALKEAIETLIQNPQMRKKFGEMAQKRVNRYEKDVELIDDLLK